MQRHYKQEYEDSILHPSAFWLEKAKSIPWYSYPTIGVSQDESGLDRWFVDGQINTCYAALDFHVENGRGEQTALVYDSPVTDTIKKYTYKELLSEVEKLAGGLVSLGVQKGDRVLIYMPMIPQAVFAMLACARLGAVHSVVFGGFAAHELAIRIDDASPKVLITATSGIEVDRIIPYKPILDEAISQAASKPEHVVVFNRHLGAPKPVQPIDIDYEVLLAQASAAPCTILNATDPLYILYTSGTTGRPKGIVRDNGGHAVALTYSMKAVYNVDPGDVFWAASDVGWVVGHSYIVYGPLLHGCTSVLYEGKPVRTPDASSFWRVIETHKVNVMFTAPTAIRAIKMEDPEGLFIKKYNLSSLRHQFLAGERCDAATLNWLKQQLNIEVIDHWWQTESGWPMVANMMGLGAFPVKEGSATYPVCGYDIRILAADGRELDSQEEGFVMVKLPLPPGCLPTLWGDQERFKAGYLFKFPGYYFTGDGGYKDNDGYIYITGRVDDIINVAGHRLSTAEMEEVVAAHPAVTECAVIGASDSLKGQVPLAIIVVSKSYQGELAELYAEVVQTVRSTIGAVAALKTVVAVERLPKTRSGKILRKLLKAIADGETYTVPGTIEDPWVLAEVKEVFAANRIGEAFNG